MKTETELREYMDRQGVYYELPIYDGKARLRVMDTTQLPTVVLDQFDERGFFKAPEDKRASKGKEK